MDRVQWNGAWPQDQRFAHLCSNTQPLADVSALSSNLLEQALTYVPEGGEGDVVLSYRELVEHYPEMELDGERLEFALGHIQQRCRQWKTHVEDLQWGVIGRCVAELPPGDEHLNRDPATQMVQVSGELESRGVQLLPSVRNEYGSGNQGEDSQ